MKTLDTLNQLGTLGEEQDPTGALNAVTYANQGGMPQASGFRMPGVLAVDQYLKDRSIYDQMVQQKLRAGANAEQVARQKQAEWEAAAPLREKQRKAQEQFLGFMESNEQARQYGQMSYMMVSSLAPILSLPEEQQPVAFEQAKRHLISSGVPADLFEDTYNAESLMQGLQSMAPIAETWAELNMQRSERKPGKPVPYLDEQGQPVFLREEEMPKPGWKPYEKADEGKSPTGLVAEEASAGIDINVTPRGSAAYQKKILDWKGREAGAKREGKSMMVLAQDATGNQAAYELSPGQSLPQGWAKVSDENEFGDLRAAITTYNAKYPISMMGERTPNAPVFDAFLAQEWSGLKAQTGAKPQGKGTAKPQSGRDTTSAVQYLKGAGKDRGAVMERIGKLASKGWTRSEIEAIARTAGWE